MGILRKVEIVSQALKYHSLGRAPAVEDATSVAKHAELALRCVGGAEIVALCGATIEAHEKGIGILVDGYIATCAALAAASLEPRVIESYFFATLSGEPGHALGLRRICALASAANIPVPAQPALNMDLRLGEGSAATLAVPILRAAATLLTGQFATLEEVLEASG